jgi:hypothetical protein
MFYTHRRLLILCLALGLALFTFLACGESNTGTAVTATSQPSTPVKPASHFHIGQLISVGKTWQVQVVSVKTSNGGEFLKPKSGNVYLIVTIAVKNISQEEQNISSLAQFHLQDASGQEYTATIDPDAGATLDGKVEAGSPRRGVIVYEVPKAVKGFTLGFEADLASSGQTIWDIKV